MAEKFLLYNIHVHIMSTHFRNLFALVTYGDELIQWRYTEICNSNKVVLFFLLG